MCYYPQFVCYLYICTGFRFSIVLTLSVLKASKKLIFEIPVFLQTLNINNWRTTSTKSINLHFIIKLVFKEGFFVKAIFTLTVFEILLFEGRSVLALAQWRTGSKRNKIPVKNQNKIQRFLNCLKSIWQRFGMVFNIFDFVWTPENNRK